MEQHPLELKWGVSKETILDAIYSSGGYTQRSVRGVLAEHLFQPIIEASLPGWAVTKGDGEGATDYFIKLGEDELVIQCKTMRSEKGAPMMRDNCPVVECQKTNGTVKGTRLYDHTQFDILAVALWPLSGKWDDWAFCCAYHLTPQKRKANQIKSIQRIDLPHGLWTKDLPLAVSRAAGKQAVRQTQKMFTNIYETSRSNPPRHP